MIPASTECERTAGNTNFGYFSKRQLKFNPEADFIFYNLFRWLYNIVQPWRQDKASAHMVCPGTFCSFGNCNCLYGINRNFFFFFIFLFMPRMTQHWLLLDAKYWNKENTIWKHECLHLSVEKDVEIVCQTLLSILFEIFLLLLAQSILLSFSASTSVLMTLQKAQWKLALCVSLRIWKIIAILLKSQKNLNSIM